MLTRKLVPVFILLGIFYSGFAVSDDVVAPVAEHQSDEQSSVANESNHDLSQHQANPSQVKITTPPVSTSSSTAVGSGLVGAEPFTMMFGLLFIVLLIFLIAFLLKKINGGSFVGGQSMEVVAALSVGTREKVVLVDVAGKQILLGVAPGRVSHLKDFDEPVVVNEERGDDFANKLKNLLHPVKSNSAVEEK
jgi:flagellar protein FliO/FliZ